MEKIGINYENVPFLITSGKYRQELHDAMAGSIESGLYTSAQFREIFEKIIHKALLDIMINLCVPSQLKQPLQERSLDEMKNVNIQIFLKLVQENRDWLLDILDKIIDLEKFTKVHFGKIIKVIRGE